jgi:hypothetical protein
MVGNVIGSYGFFAWSCGMLAAVLESWDEAERPFTAALAMNGHIGARPWIVHTRRSYAEMLVDRDAPGDRSAPASSSPPAAPRPSSSAWRASSCGSSDCRRVCRRSGMQCPG